MNMFIYLFALIACFIFNIDAYPNERDSYKRDDPDSTASGFFPFWGATLLIISGFFLIVTALGLIGYLLGWRTPKNSHHQASTDSATPFFVIQNFTTVI